MRVAAEDIDRSLLQNPDRFRRRIEERLATTPLDFADSFQEIKKTWKEPKKHLAAGVFLLLQYENSSLSPTGKEPVFLLIKRSAAVAQSGDVSCPGGMLNPFLDSLTSVIGRLLYLPFQGASLTYARQRDYPTFRTILLFIANAARESWEEIGLSPFNISFLGALPTYSLRMFRRTIFPVVGMIRHPWHYQPNSEVEKIIEIPVSAFFDPENYCRCYLDSDTSWLKKDELTSYFPCLILKQDDDTEEILWGATFNIIANFLQVVFGYSLPAFPENARTISKRFPDNYLRGNSR